MLSDFEHQSNQQPPLQDILVLQEFFSSGLCLTGGPAEPQGLKLFARENMKYEEHGIEGIPPQL